MVQREMGLLNERLGKLSAGGRPTPWFREWTDSNSPDPAQSRPACEAGRGEERESSAPSITVQAHGGVLPAQAVRDLPADAFPFVVEFLNQERVVIHRIDVPGPGGISIPGLATKHGPVSVRITFANGEVMEEGPPSAPGE